VKLAIVVQRYGEEINGGAELHARYIAELLSEHAEVEVLTTCARDYITWRNEFPAGVNKINGLTVRRFPVRNTRNTDDFGRRSEYVFRKTHSLKDELNWLNSEGPKSPELIKYIKLHKNDYNYFIFWCFRYYQAYHGIRNVPSRAILVPTAERDDALGLKIFGPLFRGVRALIYNSFEERALVENVSENSSVPSAVIGVGSDIPKRCSAQRFRKRTGIKRRFAIYVGRIDQNKGCRELFDYFKRYSENRSLDLDLVLIGNPIIPIPSTPRIKHLGFVSDEQKFDAIAAAEILIMPSYFESLSIVILEAWGLGIPVLVNGQCDVLLGQVIRSNAGLYYKNYEEFSETLHVIEHDSQLRTELGRNGRSYYQRHYNWSIVEHKWLRMLEQLKRDDQTTVNKSIEPLPGWLNRHRRLVKPAEDILRLIPTGPVYPNQLQRKRFQRND